MAVPSVTQSPPLSSGLIRRYREFLLISRDPVLFMSLISSGIFLFIFIIFPLFMAIRGGFFNQDGYWDLTYFGRYFDSEYGPFMQRVFLDTMIMGLLTATTGTILGFIFAYSIVRCELPGKQFIHWLALVPTVSPPFAIALSAILLFGRNGLITAKLLGIEYVQGTNDIYGMDGLVIVQTITFFSVAYLILRAMLERLNPSMEEAAASMGASRFRIFRTITLPLLIPGIAASYLLLFVEALADLGNPVFIGGNLTVLSSQIFLAVIGEFNYQKASTLSLVLLIPTLVIFMVQRYYVNRRSYISVTGKPTGGQIQEKDPLIRWFFNGSVYLTCLLVVLIYATILYGSFATNWGRDFTPTLTHWTTMFTRGIKSIMDTTFLSALSTPVAALVGMIIAVLVVRRKFSGKEAFDFTSNLGGAVPGTILGIGFIMAFNQSPTVVVILLFALLAVFFIQSTGQTRRSKLLLLVLGVGLGVGLSKFDQFLDVESFYYTLGGIYGLASVITFIACRQRRQALAFLILGIYLTGYNWIELVAQPIANFSRSLGPGFSANAVFQFSAYVKVIFQVPPVLLAIVLIFAGVILTTRQSGFWRTVNGILALAVPTALTFTGEPLVLVGGAYIIMMAYIVRSLPASVRSGVAALQQIDPSIEEASSILGADAQYTFRKVTLPLILPALLAGLIFSFTRHMTSLSAIIFLVNARWRIVTASLLSGWEQEGIMITCAYSSLIIFVVLLAIGVLYFITNKLFRGRGDVDLSIGV